MTKSGVRTLGGRVRGRRVAVAPALAPGLHAATIELASKGSYCLRTVAGERVKARLAPGVDPALANECLRDRRTVLVTAHAKGALIVGALQVTAAAAPNTLRLEATDIELCAAKTIVLRVGKSLVVVSEQGAVQMLGEGMTVRMAKTVRVLSANVELP
jgi:hypothetical protein